MYGSPWILWLSIAMPHQLNVLDVSHRQWPQTYDIFVTKIPKNAANTFQKKFGTVASFAPHESEPKNEYTKKCINMNWMWQQNTTQIYEFCISDPRTNRIQIKSLESRAHFSGSFNWMVCCAVFFFVIIWQFLRIICYRSLWWKFCKVVCNLHWIYATRKHHTMTISEKSNSIIIIL